jgi:hypothetical protein
MRMPFSSKTSSSAEAPNAFSPSTVSYLLRSGADGRVESICLHCFRTVIVAQNEAERRKAESLHTCDRLDLHLAHGFLRETSAQA